MASSVSMLRGRDRRLSHFHLRASPSLLFADQLVSSCTAPTFGLQLRAVDAGPQRSRRCFGINADRIYSLTFAYGAGLAGLAGAIVSPLKSVSPDMGTGYVVDAFLVVVLGGVQSLFGTVASAFVLGEVSGVIAFLQNDTIAKATVLIVIISAHPLPAPGPVRRKGARMSKPPQSPSRQRATGFWQPELFGIVILIAAMYLMPYVLVDDFLINKFSRYLVFGMLAMALSLSWGYGGILNLGQALQLRSRLLLHGHGAQAAHHPGSDRRRRPAGLHGLEQCPALPWFWVPFHSMTFAIVAGIVVPSALMAGLGWFMFRGAGHRRVCGDHHVRHAGRRQSADHRPAALYRRLQRHHRSGPVDHRRHRFRRLQRGPLIYLIASVASVILVFGYVLSRTKAGLILQAIRDHETGCSYFGYDVAGYQIFVFGVSAAIAGLAGMLYTIVMEFASPTFLNVPLSLRL